MWREYINAGSLDEAIRALAEKGSSTRVVAGATDLILEMERGVRPGIDCLIDLSRIPGANQITLDEDGWLHLGPTVTHAQCLGSRLLREYALPLVMACAEVGSPQIRNRGTVTGNLVTASPANDTITPLRALGAELLLRSAQGERVLPLEQFYLGVRRTALQEGELVVDVRFPALKSNQRGIFLKYALRRAQAISLVNLAAVVAFDAKGLVERCSLTFGAVAPTIIHARTAEAYLIGKTLMPEFVQEAARLASEEVRPISDVRGSARYRKAMARVLCERGLRQLSAPGWKDPLPESPVLLGGDHPESFSINAHSHIVNHQNPIIATLNGKKRIFESGQHKSLLRLLREEGLLVGVKEGCAEGECGACTVILDGMAVMACMVPAPRAHGAEIITVEGLAKGETLHPVQSAFIAEGAVQCGYCTPGFIMSAVKLLEEVPHPDQEQIKQALTGNLCRCTGYYKIVQAIEMASVEGGD